MLSWAWVQDMSDTISPTNSPLYWLVQPFILVPPLTVMWCTFLFVFQHVSITIDIRLIDSRWRRIGNRPDSFLWAPHGFEITGTQNESGHYSAYFTTSSSRRLSGKLPFEPWLLWANATRRLRGTHTHVSPARIAKSRANSMTSN